MARNGAGVYSKPSGTTPANGDDIDPAKFNTLMDDIAADLNVPRPVVAGGTGASSAAAALVNLGVGVGSLVPSGVIAMWSGAVVDIPGGWSLCDGTGSTPDLRGRFIVGASGDYAVGDTGGASSVTLAGSQIPSHLHTFSATTGTSGSHSHTIIRDLGGSSGVLANSIAANQGISNLSPVPTTTDGAHTHTISGSTGTSGSGDSHENRPPYYALCFIRKD